MRDFDSSSIAQIPHFLPLTIYSKSEPRKKKRRLSETDSGKKNSSTPEKGKKTETPDPETEKEEKEDKPAPAAFSFYRDTLETPEEEEDKPVFRKPVTRQRTKEEENKEDKEAKDEGDEAMETSQDADAEEESSKEVGLMGRDCRVFRHTATGSFPKFQREDSASPKQSPKKDGSDNEEDKTDSDKESDEPREVKGILVYHRGKGKRNKAIKWKPETKLVEVKYFDMDDEERVNVNKLKFENMRAIESQMEKEAVKQKDMQTELEHLEVTWYTPKRIDIGDTREPFTPGEGSEESKVQFAREKMVLEALYFNKAMTPPTPAEPDPETNPVRKEQLIIPLEDKEAGEEAEIDFKAVGWPEPKVRPC